MSLRTDPDFFVLLADSYHRLLNRPLVPDGMSASDGAAWLYCAAPFGILAHDASADPVFVYGNKRAQAIFEYDWDELTALPSRLSAEPMERRERQLFLDKVTQDGFVSEYRGVRITKTGKRFWIERATVWQLTDAAGNVRGQAAMIPQIRPVDASA
ncbi:MEKHLA domain-containing protein [Burkholderia ubonensis]|uniref:MEKHLA domain-containing protein n=1 Tax=Burkholderia ubonensis TaxID=101571 RepID=UPI0007571F88|nr:MEKHLA domain-containing protein [Burkholderia ubonensis]KVH69815.1 MEKHLA domain-containing protein [Burkholderia ubonensis]KVU06871.1 MEKHLA domain-containing protein [Burkholderia ubonensis]KWB64014.1 MEKHLA domain-containing protein [Burkholderia ubonensis]